MLSIEQIEFFNANGFLAVEDAVLADQLQRLRDDFATWVEESRAMMRHGANSSMENLDLMWNRDTPPPHLHCAELMRHMRS